MAPNRYHNLFVADYVQRFPHAEFHCAPGLEKKRGDLKFTSVLGNTALPGAQTGVAQRMVVWGTSDGTVGRNSSWPPK